MRFKQPAFRIYWVDLYSQRKVIAAIDVVRSGSRAAATSKMECFVINSSRFPAVNYYHKALHLGCCSSPRSASGCGVVRDWRVTSSSFVEDTEESSSKENTSFLQHQFRWINLCLKTSPDMLLFKVGDLSPENLLRNPIIQLLITLIIQFLLLKFWQSNSPTTSVIFKGIEPWNY